MPSRSERVEYLQSLAAAELAGTRFIDSALVLRIFDDAQMKTRPNCTYEQLVDAISKAQGTVIDIRSLLKKQSDQ
jgi:hypothetical protein